MFKNYPLPSHPFADKAARAALAAGSQGKFLAYHDGLFRNYAVLNDEKLQDLARELNLDMGKFAEDMQSKRTGELISRDLMEGDRAGVQGTPTMYVNGKALQARSAEAVFRAIEEERRKTAGK